MAQETNYELRTLACALLLCGCGGSDFSSSATPGGDGGALPVGIAPPEPSLGPTETGADGGAAAAADGATLPDGRLTPDPPVPAAVDAAVDPACPMPQLTPEDMPDRIVWESYFYQKGDECFMCALSPCGSCPVAWFPVEQEGDRVTAVLNYDDCRRTFSPFPISFGTCGSEAQNCGWYSLSGFAGTTVEFRLVPDATGWAVAELTPFRGNEASAGSIAGVGATCGNSIIDGQLVAASVTADFEKTMRELRWDCP